MCLNTANLLVGATKAIRSEPAWIQAYRAVNHGVAKHACLNQKVMKKFPKSIEDFGNEFVQAQIKRHAADYAPDVNYRRSEVLLGIDAAEQAIKDFKQAKTSDKRAFAAWVTLVSRTGKQ